jgi:hypothetical protein
MVVDPDYLDRNRLRVWWSIAFLFCIGILFNVTVRWVRDVMTSVWLGGERERERESLCPFFFFSQPCHHGFVCSRPRRQVKNVLDTTYYKFVWTACLMLSLGAALILLWWFLSLLEQHLAESNTLDVYSDRLDTFRHFLVGITLCFSTIILLQIYSLYAGISTPTPYMGQACSVEYFSPFILISASLALHQGWTSNAPLHENGARVHPSKGRLSTAMEQTLFSPDTPASVSGPVVSNLNSDRTAWPDIVPSSAP